MRISDDKLKKKYSILYTVTQAPSSNLFVFFFKSDTRVTLKNFLIDVYEGPKINLKSKF